MSRLTTLLIAALAASMPVFAATPLPDPEAPVPKNAPGVLLGPMVMFTAPGEVEIRWQTMEPRPSTLMVGPIGEERHAVSSEEAVTTHAVLVSGLSPDAVYEYVLTGTDGNAATESTVYTFDTTFNYAPQRVPMDLDVYGDDWAKTCARAAEAMTPHFGQDFGYLLVYGCGEGHLALEFAKRTGFTIFGVDTDVAAIERGRQKLSKAGLYGSRITLRHVESLDEVPLVGYYANAIVSETALRGTMPGNAIEVRRLLAPNGVALIGAPKGIDSAAVQSWTGIVEANAVSEGGEWAQMVGRLPDGAGSWTHQYADAANTANSQDHLNGAQGTGDVDIQWVGRPGADFGIDRNPRMPAPLASNGRLYHQGLNRMAAMDAYNGAILWLAEIPGLRRVNIPRDASNWCIDDDAVYTAIADRCWRLDAATGDLLQSYGLPDDSAESPKEWSYVARVGDMLYGSSIKEGSSYTDFFGKDAWYDGVSGEGTHKICSDTLFAQDLDSGETRWTYGAGKIVNTTICIGDGHVYFVESRHPDVLAAPTSQIDIPELWLDQYLVALDAATGKLVWETPIDTIDGIVVFFMQYDKGHLLLSPSHDGQYNIYSFSAADGSEEWHVSHPWSDDDHSGHMQHPVIVANEVFLVPNGYAMADGALTTEKVGMHEGCSTYAGTYSSLVYRGFDRRVSMWGIENEEVTSWISLRPSCWLSVIPSGGMILAPEGGGGCSCGNWVETSIGFIPLASNK